MKSHNDTKKAMLFWSEPSYPKVRVFRVVAELNSWYLNDKKRKIYSFILFGHDE